MPRLPGGNSTGRPGLASPGMREPLAPGIAAPGVAVADPRWSPAGSRLVWLRTAPDGAELVVAPTDGSGPPLTIRPDPAPERVRATGGGVLAWAGEDRLLYVAADGRLCSLRLPDGDPSPGPAAVVAATDGTISAPAVAPGAGLVAFVVEAADWCAVTVAPLDGDGAPVRRSTADWAWDPAWSPDGLLAWQEWDFPAMPWDGSRVVVVDGTDPGARPRSLAGGAGVAVGQPRFAPDGRLAYVSDEHGWWNVWVEPAPGRGPTRERRPLLEEPFEHADPGWEAGQRSYAWSPGGDAVALCRNEDGFGRLVVVDRDGRARALRRGWHHGLDWGPGGIAAVRARPRAPARAGAGDVARRRRRHRSRAALASGAGRRVRRGGPGADRRRPRRPDRAGDGRLEPPDPVPGLARLGRPAAEPPRLDRLRPCLPAGARGVLGRARRRRRRRRHPRRRRP